MNEFAALQDVNYDTLVLNRSQATKKTQSGLQQPICLVDQCCTVICRLGTEACAEAAQAIPVHMAKTLLTEAIRLQNTNSVSAIIANWPLHTLCFREILPPDLKDSFAEEVGLDLMVFKGVTDRTRRCRMRCLDFTGLKLNNIFVKLIVQMLPILSLRPAQRNIRKLTNIVLRQAECGSSVIGLKKDNKLAQEIIPKLIKDFLNNDSTLSKYAVRMLRGEKMVVKIDRVQFSTQNTFFMDYLITNCLRHITPLTVQAANVIIKSDLNVGDEILDSLAPFIVFRGQHLENIDGIWLQNLEDNVFFIVHQDLSPFTSIRSLGIQNCNISLQAGRTRRRTQARKQFTDTLAAFPNLSRLDVSQNSFQGVLEEIGEAMVRDLVYLNLRECDLKDKDIEYLAQSRHAQSLRELNVSRVCGLYPEDDFAVSSQVLVTSLRHFVNLSVLHLHQNHMTDARMRLLSEIVRNHLSRLKYLNILDNIIAKDAALEVVFACTCVKTMQVVKVPYAHNMLDGVSQHATERREFENRIKLELKHKGRTDINVEIQNLAYAILPNM